MPRLRWVDGAEGWVQRAYRQAVMEDAFAEQYADQLGGQQVSDALLAHAHKRAQRVRFERACLCRQAPVSVQMNGSNEEHGLGHPSWYRVTLVCAACGVAWTPRVVPS